MPDQKEATILGAGSWGTALAIHLARCGRGVTLWVHDGARAAAMSAQRKNSRYLPDHRLPDGVEVTADMAAALEGARCVFLVVPSHHARDVLTQSRRHWPAGAPICSASKGIESDTLLRMSEVAREVLGPLPVASLSGPSFAREVADGHPTAVVVGSTDPVLAGRLQELVSGGVVRAYTNTDLIGVELGGALKNVIAIGAGAAEGLGYGTNTIAALITRGLAEMSRLASALGGEPETMAGLAGLGDLVLTCTGKLSRNRALGADLARGTTLAAHLAGTPMVAEGVRTTVSAWSLARREGVAMPIVGEVHALLHEGKPVKDAIDDLLRRQLTSE